MKLKEVLIKIRNYFFFIVIGILLVVITFKNGTINKQKKLLVEKPKIELVYRDTTYYLPGDTISIPVEVEVHDSIPYEVERFLTSADSAEIAAAYTKVYTDFNSKYTYEKTFKDDTTAYIFLKQTISQNKPIDQLLTFTNRTPIVYVTNIERIRDRTFSLLGGIEGGIQGVKVGIGLVDYSNRFYKISYNPFDNAVEAGVYVPLFNLKK